MYISKLTHHPEILDYQDAIYLYHLLSRQSLGSCVEFLGDGLVYLVEGRKCFISERIQHILSTVIFFWMYGKGPLSKKRYTFERVAHVAEAGFLSRYQNGPLP